MTLELQSWSIRMFLYVLPFESSNPYSYIFCDTRIFKVATEVGQGKSELGKLCWQFEAPEFVVIRMRGHMKEGYNDRREARLWGTRIRKKYARTQESRLYKWGEWWASNLQSNNNDCSQTAWMPIPASLLPTCMDFNKLLYFSEPQHPPAKLSNNSTSFRTEWDHA